MLVTWVTLWFFEKNYFGVTGSRWSRGPRGFFRGKFCFWVTGSRGSRCVFLVNFVSGTHGHAGHVVFCNIVSGSQSHAGHVGHVVFF